MHARVFYHDRCFDGACSAAIFSDFYRKVVRPGAALGYTGVFHRAEQLFDEDLFDGDENAIVDFKYSASDRLTWWFDHHQSAFLSDADAKHFERDRSGKKFYDPHYGSCTQFIADVARDRFGYDPKPLADLIRWADIIDGALYESAQAAVEMPEPAMKLTLVFEASEKNLTREVIPLMMSHSLGEIIERPDIKAVFEDLYRRHLESIEIIRKRASCRRGVVFFDLADTDLAGYNKFIPYYLYPESIYTVSVLDAGFRTKISVGSNPWARREPERNLATLCESYGGGGHARVGAISYAAGEIDRARASAREIVELLADEE